ncbi:MAG: hypothetical protein NTW21_42040 [Verrucomicrobia bacterium]|nr:hypothetical protein [Verrucomicrobiota bacterium]
MSKYHILTPGTAALLSLLTIQTVIADDAAAWKPAPGTLLSKFAKDVDPKAPLPEYPRPQMERKDWMNLNGLWEYAILPLETPKFESQGSILVPYPVESALSGVRKPLGPKNHLWYKRAFEVAKDWSGKQILLHFGAVDWRAEVSINGQVVGKHEGGYDDTNKAMRLLIAQGLSAAIYTETSDIEGGINGFMTYDREVIKVPAAKIKASNETLKQ